MDIVFSKFSFILLHKIQRSGINYFNPSKISEKTPADYMCDTFLFNGIVDR